MRNYLSSVEFPLKILLVPNAFKGSLEAPEFCRILVEELSSGYIVPIALPMCDGGDGTAPILASYLNFLPVNMASVDALGRPKIVTYYTGSDMAIVDLASICGLKDLLSSEYDVFNTHTAGLGKVLVQIQKQGIHRILLGVGGSASIDGGLGALVEMGLKIVKSSNQYQNHLLELQDIDTSILKENFKNLELLILCDVENRLCGKEGAAETFGPQKGATPLQVSKLDVSLCHYANLLLSKNGTDVFSLRHGGAAGGIAAAFYTLLGAQLVSGADFCLRLSDFDRLLPGANLVITGEGKLDRQSLQGKLPGVIAKRCHQHRVPVIAIAGMADPLLPGFDQIYTLAEYAGNPATSIQYPELYLRRITKDLKRDILKLI